MAMSTLLLFVGCLTVLVALVEANASVHSRFGHVNGRTQVRGSLSLNGLLASQNITGSAVVRIGTDQNRVFEQHQGSSTFRGFMPIDRRTRFTVGSNTKVWTAISLYQLQERGLVNLSRTVQSYITQQDLNAWGVTSYCPQVSGDPPGMCRNFTFVDLLSMSACLGSNDVYLFLPFPGTLGQAFGYFASQPLVCVPGTGAFFYSNPSFILSAYFVERFSGMSLQDYFRTNIFARLGMWDTFFDPWNGQYNADLFLAEEWREFLNANNHAQVQGRGRCQPELVLGTAGGAGGGISTQDDEAKLYFTLFNFMQSSVGAPLFTQRQSLLDLVRPRTYIEPAAGGAMKYFAQGLGVVVSSASQMIPTVIFYEGSTFCTTTMNWLVTAQLDATSTHVIKPRLLSQVWSAVLVFYPSVANFTQASTTDSTPGYIFDNVDNWPQRMNVGDVATYLAGQLAPSS